MTRHLALSALMLTVSIAAISCGGHNPAQPTPTDTALTAPMGDGSGALTAGTSAATAHNSEQLVFSGTATESTFGSPVGFWIWCEVESDNPYHDECNGAMYFYALGITAHVEDQENGIQEPVEGVYQIKVQSTKDSSVACTLQNSAPPVHGPHNTVTIDCTSPSGHAVSSTAVVNVTGP